MVIAFLSQFQLVSAVSSIKTQVFPLFRSSLVINKNTIVLSNANSLLIIPGIIAVSLSSSSNQPPLIQKSTDDSLVIHQPQLYVGRRPQSSLTRTAAGRGQAGMPWLLCVPGGCPPALLVRPLQSTVFRHRVQWGAKPSGVQSVCGTWPYSDDRGTPTLAGPGLVCRAHLSLCVPPPKDRDQTPAQPLWGMLKMH